MLHSALSSPSDPETDLGALLSRAIASVDVSLAESITSLFPGIEAMSDEEVDAIVEKKRDTIALAQSGTTALLALVDEKRENVWVANLGDCMGGKLYFHKDSVSSRASPDMLSKPQFLRPKLLLENGPTKSLQRIIMLPTPQRWKGSERLILAKKVP